MDTGWYYSPVPLLPEVNGALCWAAERSQVEHGVAAPNTTTYSPALASDSNSPTSLASPDVTCPHGLAVSW